MADCENRQPLRYISSWAFASDETTGFAGRLLLRIEEYRVN
jgi:hypothetical protein